MDFPKRTLQDPNTTRKKKFRYAPDRHGYSIHSIKLLPGLLKTTAPRHLLVANPTGEECRKAWYFLSSTFCASDDTTFPKSTAVSAGVFQCRDSWQQRPPIAECLTERLSPPIVLATVFDRYAVQTFDEMLSTICRSLFNKLRFSQTIKRLPQEATSLRGCLIVTQSNGGFGYPAGESNQSAGCHPSPVLGLLWCKAVRSSGLRLRGLRYGAWAHAPLTSRQ